jgi:predicted nuclease with RNAse H fold
MDGNSPTVAGIDVGGPKKGFHAVALHNGQVADTATDLDPGKIVKWCRKHGASIVAVDAPCHWSITGRARTAERELMAEGIWCFSTPTRGSALHHPKKNFDWMLNGEALFKELKSRYALFADQPWERGTLVCLESFPHAIVCALAGQVVPAKPKATRRRKALQDIGIDTTLLTNIDLVDAALCAVAARAFALGSTTLYGDAAEGVIVVPGSLK